MPDNLVKTTIIKDGNYQALRIPQEMKTDKKDYYIRKIDDIYIAYPSDDPWATVRKVIGTFPSGLLNDRTQ